MKRILFIFVLSINVIIVSGQHNIDSPYAIFGDNTPTLDIKRHNIDSGWSMLALLPDSTLANIAIEKELLTVTNALGEILTTQVINPILRSIYFGVDPKAVETPWASPYVYCLANPVKYIDPSGCSPIYSSKGKFLGTDENGLKGEWYVLDESDFKQGMPQSNLNKLIIDKSNLSPEVINTINTHYNTLPSRPDFDGYLTLKEANEWYRNGGGEPLFVDINKIDLSGIVWTGEEHIGEKKSFNLLMGASHNLNDGLVYGNLTFKRYPNNAIKAYTDIYDFDIKPWTYFSNWPRNLETIIGNLIARKGTPYEINIYGEALLNPRVP